MKSFKFLAMLLFTALVSNAWATEITIEANGQTISDATIWENCTVNITGDGTVTFGSRIYINGDVALNLGAGATLIANGGIGVHEGNSLTIDGEGNLTANSNTFSEAAIGGSYGSPNAGTITISGGTINASNNSKGVSAAIGGGYSNYGGNGTIIINGGTITTNIIQGGAASIGGSKGANGGHITIAGGSITANRSGAVTGAGIGGGEKGNAGIIIISGGTVTVPASSSARGAGIGSGEKSDGEGSITINDGNITAVGGAIGGSAGIGGGSNSSAGTITITGGVVNATGGYESAGIGGARGVNGSGGTIAISGGQVTARGSDGAYGIGPSKDGAEGTISMSWTDNTDFIDASYAGTITILKGKRFFYDETEMFAKAEGLYKQEKKIIPAVLDNSLLSSGEILMQRNFVTTEGTAVDVSYDVYDYNGDKLTDGTDYTTVIKNSNEQIVTTFDQLGDYTLTVTGMGNYSGSNAYTFSLVEWDMALMQDGSEHYVNLPENGTKTVYLNVGQSIKVYDSEGKDGKLVASDGRLLLHVPTGYALVVSGKTDAMKWNEVQHETTNFLSAYENENLTDEITTLFGNSNNISFASAGNSMLIRLNAQKIYRYDDQYGLELTISVQKSLSHSDITIATIPDQTYSGSEICPEISVKDGEIMLILGTDYTVECANNVSAGTANMTINGMGDYTGSISKTFEILKAPLTVTGVSVENKVYDGSTSATITGTATVSGVLGSDDVDVEYGMAVFADANVGEGIAVAFNGFTLTGADKNNYYLSNQPASVTANITKAPLTITAKDKTIVYGDEPANDGVEYNGFLGSDDASVLGGTLTYGYNYEIGNDTGEYTITPNGLTADNYNITFVNGTLTVEPKRRKFAAVTIEDDQDGRTAVLDCSYDRDDEINLPEFDDGIEVNAIKVKRTFGINTPATIVLPFKLPTETRTNADFYDLYSVEQVGNTWKARMEKIPDGHIQPLHPYAIIVYEEELTFDLQGKHVTVYMDENEIDTVKSQDKLWYFVGVYQYKTWGGDKDNELGLAYAFAGRNEHNIAKGQFGKIAAGGYAYPLRAYLRKKDASVQLKPVQNRPLASGEQRAASVANLFNEDNTTETIEVEFFEKDQNGEEHTTFIGRMDTRTGEFSSIRPSRTFDLKGRHVGKPKAKGAYFKK